MSEHPVHTEQKIEDISINDENRSEIIAQSSPEPSCGCGGSKAHMPEKPTYVYAIGKIKHHFPNRSIEMELFQATGRIEEKALKGMTRDEALHKTIVDPNNRYIRRQLCYVFSIENLETYILIPSDQLDIDRLAESIGPIPEPNDIDIVIGRLGPISTPAMCNGLIVPTVIVDQVYTFDRNTLMKSIPRPKDVNEAQFTKTSKALFNHIMQIAHNAGMTDEDRALNYLSVRLDTIYHTTQEMQDKNYYFSGIDVRNSRLSGVRKILDVIFAYENNMGSVKKWFVRVDVTEEFPFVVTNMREYFDR